MRPNQIIAGTSLGLLFLFFLFACEKPKSIGADIIPAGDLLNVQHTDTFTVELETVAADSIRSDEQVISMFGSMIDPDFGRIHAATFTEFRMTGSNLLFGDSLSLDSLVLDLELTGFYGDYSDIQKLRVYEINEALNRSGVYYNTDSVEVLNQTNLVSGSSGIVKFNSDTEFKKGLKIRLSDELANRILNASPDQLLNNENFRAFFKGLYISTEAIGQTSKEPGAVYYFNPGGLITGLTLYYNGKITGVYSDSLSYRFLINDDAGRFNRVIRSETQGKLFDQVLNNPSEYVLTQAGVPAYIYVKIPNLRNIFPVAVNKAELEIPVMNEYFGANAKYQPPTILKGNFATNDRRLDDSVFTSAIYDVNRNLYSVILSNYTQVMINDQSPNYGFFLSSLNINTNINRVVLAGANYPTRKPRLKLTYTSVPR